jgi:hypothetical protein
MRDSAVGACIWPVPRAPASPAPHALRLSGLQQYVHHEGGLMKTLVLFRTLVVWLVLVGSALANNTYGSVEPFANSAVLDIAPLRGQAMVVREAFAERLLQCGMVDDVIDVLTKKGSVTTINRLNTRFEVGAGGFAGSSNPSYVFTISDTGPNAASLGDISVLTDSLGFVLSQGSAFLLDADNAGSFDFPANYVVLNFPSPPSLQQSAALFKTVGKIDPELFETDSSGYTQFGRAYLSLQSFVPDEQFIAGYVAAAVASGVEYTPIVGGVAALFTGGAAFPGNDWVEHDGGEEYLSRIPPASHQALARLRDAHLRFTRNALDKINEGPHTTRELRAIMRGLACQ